MINTCNHCLGEYEAVRSTSRYCSRSCYRRARYAEERASFIRPPARTDSVHVAVTAAERSGLEAIARDSGVSLSEQIRGSSIRYPDHPVIGPIAVVMRWVVRNVSVDDDGTICVRFWDRAPDDPPDIPGYRVARKRSCVEYVEVSHEG